MGGGRGLVLPGVLGLSTDLKGGKGEGRGGPGGLESGEPRPQAHAPRQSPPGLD